MEINFASEECHCLANPRLPSSTPKPPLDLPSHVWIATSGTTGAQKWAALSKEAILTSAAAVNQHFQIVSNDVWINPLPLFHVGGLGIQARAYLSGSQVLPMAAWDVHAFFDLCQQATLSALVPAQLYDLIRAGYRSPPSFRALVIGGGALEEELFEKAVALGWPIAPSYGMTECCSQVATAFPRETQMRILSHVELADSPLKIRSESLLTAYWQEGRRWDPKEDGWFQTEDLVQVSHPFVSFKGRIGDQIKILGENVNLLALQAQFDRIARLYKIDGCILAEKDPRKGNSLTLYTTADVPSQVAILQHFNAEVMPYERIEAVKQVDWIPRTSLGKMEKHRLVNGD